MQGRLFDSCSIILIMISALQLERCFYSIPHKMGYFDEDCVLKDLAVYEEQINEKSRLHHDKDKTNGKLLEDVEAIRAAVD